MKDISIYIHIPYCLKKCNYCHFLSQCNYESVNDYVHALCCELEQKSKKLQDRVVKTIFFGGGTPTTLPYGCLTEIVNTIKRCYHLDIKEFSVEGNPKTYTQQKIDELKSIGINRVSVGIQSLNDRTLSILGRIHTAEEGLQCIKLLKKNFDNVNCDIMVGLPDCDIKQVEYTARAILDCNITHLSCYGLQIEKGTPFYTMQKKGLYIFPDDDTSTEQYDKVLDISKEYGFQRYEISNFAKKGYECLHNLNYWEGGDYVGIGVSAHGCIDGTRYANILGIQQYIDNICIGKRVRSYSQKEDLNSQKKDRIMVGLRLTKGLNVDKFNEDFNTDFMKEFEDAIKKTAPYTFYSQGYFGVKEEYLYVVNGVIVEFI